MTHDEAISEILKIIQESADREKTVEKITEAVTEYLKQHT